VHICSLLIPQAKTTELVQPCEGTFYDPAPSSQTAAVFRIASCEQRRDVTCSQSTVVLVHGSLAETRWGTILFYADRFARRGIAALVYDKRGTGASTGDWKTATYEDLSDDALAGIHLLQTRKEIYSDQIGAFGHSEGGAVVAIMAARSKDVAFLISADGTTGPSYKQDLFRVRKIVESNGFAKEEVTKAMAFYNMWLQLARTGHGREQLDAEIPKSRERKMV
jgi:pimeloyl-ACP methyl ester carboxylesterase